MVIDEMPVVDNNKVRFYEIPGLRHQTVAARPAGVSTMEVWQQTIGDRAGARGALGLGVMLAHELLDAAVPAGVLEAARREPAIVRAARIGTMYRRQFYVSSFRDHDRQVHRQSGWAAPAAGIMRPTR
jgi:hypothetical protein